MEIQWRLPNLFYADYLVSCGESERFVEVCRRIGLKVHEAKSNVMESGGEKGLQ